MGVDTFFPGRYNAREVKSQLFIAFPPSGTKYPTLGTIDLREALSVFAKYEYRNNPIYVNNRNRITPCPVRFHKQLEILYVRSGQLQVNIDGKSETLRENEMYIAFPNILHAVLHGEATGMVIIVDGEMFPHYADVLARFEGVSGSADDVTLVSGATYTSKAVRAGVNAAIAAVESVK